MYEKTPQPNNLIFGLHSVIEALKSGKEIEKVLIQRNLTAPNMTLLRQLIKEHKIPYTHVPIQKLNKLCQKNHQGILAFVALIDTQEIETIIQNIFESGENPLVLILDQVTDVRNFGAICRTANCAGVHAIIVPKKNSAQINAEAIKTSSGALYHVPICKIDSISKTIDFLKHSGLQIIGCTEKTENSIYTHDYTLPCAIILGSEEDGIASRHIHQCDFLGKIPLLGHIDSLNVSTSGGVVLYEAVRQRLSQY